MARKTRIEFPGAISTFKHRPLFCFSYTRQYTARNQLKSVILTTDNSHVVDYAYDVDGFMTSRSMSNGSSSAYTPDALARTTGITFSFASAAQGQLTYAYDAVGNRQYALRGNGDADGYTYNRDSEITSFRRNGTLSGGVVIGGAVTNYFFDNAGNRTSAAGMSYSVNSLNQYTAIGGVTVSHGSNGNLSAYNGATYGYDAMNRLTSATKGADSATFYYDGLGRQVARLENGTTTYSVWDGWNLFAEYDAGETQTNRWIYAGNDLIRRYNATQGTFYYQPDGNGSTVYLSDNNGNLIERYTYDLYGTPSFADVNGMARTDSAFGIKDLFTGQRWYPDLGIYDLRHRAFRPDIGRFLQPDPIGFAGDPANLYRYCANNPVNWSDPFGLNPEGANPNGDDGVTANSDGTGFRGRLTYRKQKETSPNAGGPPPPFPEVSFRPGVAPNLILLGSLGLAHRTGGTIGGSGSGSGQRLLKSLYSRSNLVRFDRAVAHVFGTNAVLVPVQTLGNAPALDTSLSRMQLAGYVGDPRNSLLGVNGTYNHPRWTVYMASEAASSRNQNYLAAIYFHELANLLSIELAGSARAFGDPRNPDPDTGQQVENAMFGNIIFLPNP